MGGIPCLIQRNAVLQYQTVPTNPADQAKFDAQMRQLCVDVAQDIANDVPDKATAVCAILAKPEFNMADRAALLSVIEALYTPYS